MFDGTDFDLDVVTWAFSYSESFQGYSLGQVFVMALTIVTLIIVIRDVLRTHLK